MPGPVAPSHTARVIYLVLTLGVALAVGILASLRPLGAGAGLDVAAASMLRYVGVGVLVMGVLLARAFRGRIPPLAPGEDEGAWWRAHLPRAIVVWALTESVALTNGVLYFLTGDVVVLGVAALAVGVLWLARPARLTAG